MSAAAKRTRSAPVEPDRLESFSTPRQVERVFGHDEAAAEFLSSLHSGRLQHAWLLVGPEGVGKATLSYRLARTVLSQEFSQENTHGGTQDHIAGGSEDVPPDHPVFRKVAGLAHPNLLLIRRSWIEKSKRYSQWIGVDEVRRLRAFLGSTAGEGVWRVVIVDRADQLNQNAANALLKALEEPPPNTVFLLVASAEGRLPVTIRSRTRVLRLSALNEDSLMGAVRAALARDGVEADETTLALAIALSEGSVRRALELITGDGIQLYEDIVATFDALPGIDGAKFSAKPRNFRATMKPSGLSFISRCFLAWWSAWFASKPPARGLSILNRPSQHASFQMKTFPPGRMPGRQFQRRGPKSLRSIWTGASSSSIAGSVFRNSSRTMRTSTSMEVQLGAFDVHAC